MPTPQSSSLPADDPASSLRAAALLTLKSKRRRAAIETAPPPTRPVPVDDALQLDYGQEESASSGPLQSPSRSVAPSGSKEVSKDSNSTNDIEEGQIREEGEISDEDEDPVPTTAHHSKPPSPEYHRTGSPDAHVSHANQLFARPSPPATITHHLPALLERITDPPQHSLMDEDQPMNTEDVTMQDYSHMDEVSLFVDVDHVRPGIPLSQEQYNIAKDIILDLLGWGVEPEYLVDCGLSRQIVYYVFAELNLELPHNLDASDLAPFTPKAATAMLPRRAPAAREKPSSGQSLLTRLNLASRLATPPPTNMEGIQSPGTNELLDIERQRRQELLARKAAQASRKVKQAAQSAEDTSSVASSADISPSEPPKNPDKETTPVASEVVEDFLKSIAAPAESLSKPTSTTPPQAEENSMDLDEIPGLGRLSRSSSQADATGNAPAYADQIAVSPSAIHPPESTSPIISPVSHNATEGASFLPPQRRGTKRPVASDFVDLDPSQRLGPNGKRLSDVPSRPGTGANFASVSMRRCVIDLSDSEGEEDRRNAVPFKRARSKGYISPTPGRLQNGSPGSGMNTPPVAATSSAVPDGPSALELKIKQMKEEIARREQEKRKRAVASRPASTAGIRTTSIGASAPTTVVVKQEEDDSLASTAMQTDEAEINAPSSSNHTSDIPSTSAKPQVPPLDTSIAHLAMSENPSTNASAAGAPSIAESDSRGGSAFCPSPNMQGQVPDDEGLHGQADPVTSSSDEERQQEQHSVEPDTSQQQVDVDQEMSTSAEALQTTSVPQKQDGRHAPSPALSCETENMFTTYTSPFESYPLLQFRSHSVSGRLITAEKIASSLSSNAVSTALVSNTSLSSAVLPDSSVYLSSLSNSSIPTSSTNRSSNFPLPNLKPLKLAAAAKLLDPSKRICQYEVPGGGVCRDAGCEDLHLSRMLGPSTGGVSGTGGIEPNDQDAAEYLFNTLPADWLSRHGISSSKILTGLQEVRLKNVPIAFEERVAQALCALGPPPLPPPAS